MLVGHALAHKEYLFAVSLLVGFYGTLRTGEILSLKSSDVSIHTAQGPAVISLGLTKGGKRQGASESVSLTVEEPLRWLFAWTRDSSARRELCPSPSQWRKMFNTTTEALGFADLGFRPYSLRRGGLPGVFSVGVLWTDS